MIDLVKHPKESIQLFLGLGSNIQPVYHLREGLQALTDLLGNLTVSPIYESEPVGFSGPNFLNMVVGVKTELSLDCILKALRDIEVRYGRLPEIKKWSSRTLDIDVLLYGHQAGEICGIQLPRSDILECAFVLWPLADIAPDVQHPLAFDSFAALKSKQLLTQKLLLWGEVQRLFDTADS